jgi:hypothetical protein
LSEDEEGSEKMKGVGGCQGGKQASGEKSDPIALDGIEAEKENVPIISSTQGKQKSKRAPKKRKADQEKDTPGDVANNEVDPRKKLRTRINVKS